jgi:hypothetical protein
MLQRRITKAGHLAAAKTASQVPRATSVAGSAPPQRIKAGTRAFTLVEALVAGAIGAVIFTSLYAGISNSFTLLNTTRANLRATQIMVSRLEGLRLCAWGNGTNQASQLFDTQIIASTFTDYFYPEGLFDQTNSLGTAYSGTMTIQTNIALSPPASYSSNMALVTVTVTWTDGVVGRSIAHTRSLSTYVAQFGEQNYIYTH